MAALPRFISTSEAAHQLGVSVDRLRRMIEAGTIKAANISGETVVSEASIRKFHKQQPISQASGVRKEDLPEYQKFNGFAGLSISISDAAREYDIPNPTIVRWVAKGIIKRLGTDKNKVLIDHADMAYCAEVYHSHRGRGKWLFNADGTPYIPQSLKLQVSV